MEPGTRRALRKAALAAALAAPLHANGCSRPPVAPLPDPAPSPLAAPLPPPELRALHVRLEELHEHLPRYLGYTVQVTGAIQQRLASRWFTLDQRGSAESGHGILVYARGTLASTLRAGTVVTVTGTVKMLTRDDLLDPEDWPPQHDELEWHDWPGVVARQIEWRGARLPAAVAGAIASRPGTCAASAPRWARAWPCWRRSRRLQDDGDSAYTRTSRASCSMEPSRRSTRASNT